MTDMNINSATSEQLGAAITAQRGLVQALAFIAKGGSGLSSILHDVWKAKAAERKGPLHVIVYLLNNYTDDELQAIPVVGSKKGESGNKPYDRYTTQVKGETGMKSVPGSWYTDAIRATSESKWIDDVVAWCDGKEEVRPEGVPEDMKPETVPAAELKAEMLKARQDMRAALVRGCQLYLHLEEINSINPERIKVKMPMRKDPTKGELVLSGSNMIRLVDPIEEGKDDERILTVSDFLALDTDKLTGMGKDQTLTTLMNTKARKPRATGSNVAGKGAQDIKTPSDVGGFVNIANVTATSLDDLTDQGKNLVTKLYAAIAVKNEEVIMAIGALCMATDGLWNVVEGPYNQILANRASALNTKAQQERLAAKAG